MHEEWCLTAHLDGDDADVTALSAQAAEAVAADRVTREGRVLRVYTSSEPAAAQAEAELLALIEATPLGYELWQERWDEESGEWEELAPEAGAAGVHRVGAASGEHPDAAALAADGAPAEHADEAWALAEEAPPRLDAGSYPGMGERVRGCWVVKAELGDQEAAEALLARLAGAGAVASRVGAKVGLLVADSGTAEALRAELERVVPPGTVVTASPASRVERVAYGAG